MKRVFAGAVMAMGLLLAGPASWAAGGVEQLRQFVKATRSAEGEFEQTVLAKSGRKPQQAAGSFAFSRPGKFRWEYQTPYQQLLVGDGERLWIWDRDLNQVTVKRIGDALGATPAAILFGSGDLEQNFELAEGGDSEGLAWVEARPKQEGSGFEAMRIGLAGGQVKRMEMRDNFGQTTTVLFPRFVLNPPVDAGRFRFMPPTGADVIGDDTTKGGR
ncbi:outer membrane lipoprotein chaperone LolA [Azoarcus indigens]|uniref:Outer-membrane lipoprotein carrier protein n=1 Tax=Azoarcus indigens TaxID=29545 RepID=A0A4R6DXL5_9RHOO|nr:outer membrane lipoprotein chaperone LolA [Azoarcus indigens]TDN50065.1 outer membrane lipoprotein carrier protein [Azoarcus indigens]